MASLQFLALRIAADEEGEVENGNATMVLEMTGDFMLKRVFKFWEEYFDIAASISTSPLLVLLLVLSSANNHGSHSFNQYLKYDVCDKIIKSFYIYQSNKPHKQF